MSDQTEKSESVDRRVWPDGEAEGERLRVPCSFSFDSPNDEERSDEGRDRERRDRRGIGVEEEGEGGREEGMLAVMAG